MWPSFRSALDELRRAKEELHSTGYSGWMIGCGRFLLIVLVFAALGRVFDLFVPLLVIGAALALLVTTARWFRGRM